MNNDYYDYDKIDTEHRQLINEELEERIQLERNLNTIAGFIKLSLYARIGIFNVLILILLIGIIKVRF